MSCNRTWSMLRVFPARYRCNTSKYSSRKINFIFKHFKRAFSSYELPKAISEIIFDNFMLIPLFNKNVKISQHQSQQATKKNNPNNCFNNYSFHLTSSRVFCELKQVISNPRHWMSLRACDDRVLVPAIRAKSFAAWHAGYATVLPYCERISIVIVFMLFPLDKVWAFSITIDANSKCIRSKGKEASRNKGA